jgi:translation initiation factor IF-3
VPVTPLASHNVVYPASAAPTYRAMRMDQVRHFAKKRGHANDDDFVDDSMDDFPDYDFDDFDDFDDGPGRGRQNNRPKSDRPQDNIIANSGIHYPNMRVVYEDPDTGENRNEVMGKREALELARHLNLDLILVSSQPRPVVCRIESLGKHKMSLTRKDKDKRKKEKVQKVKEVQFGALAAENDIRTKLRSVEKFLKLGHPVKIMVHATRKHMQSNPLIVNETMLKVVEEVEKIGDNKLIIKQDAGEHNPMRKHFMVQMKGSAMST